jgi:hypothetical protein
MDSKMPTYHFSVTSTIAEDGVNSHITHTQGGVEDAQQLMVLFSEWARTAGFTYIEQIDGIKSDGSVVYGGF